MNKSPTGRFPAPLLIPFVLPVRCKGAAGVCLLLLGGGSSRGGEISDRIKGWNWVLLPASQTLPKSTGHAVSKAGFYWPKHPPAFPSLCLCSVQGLKRGDSAPCAQLLHGLDCPINPGGICRLSVCSDTSSQSLSGFRPFSSVRLS